MASLTPGMLLKLLRNVDNKEAKVVGEHRSALLQVIGIVPSLDDDPWKSRGFYLRVSDSIHSAYVSVLDEDVELILSDKIQLGQFIHVTRLDSGFPVPLLQGLKPVPKRRPCIGEPKDLISSDFFTVKKIVDLKRGKRNVGLEKKVEVEENPKGKMKGANGSEDTNTRRLSLSNGKVEGTVTRRMSLNWARKEWNRTPGSQDGAKTVSKSKLNGSSGLDSVLPSKKSSIEEDPASKHSSISPLKSKNVIASPKSVSKPIKKDLKSSNSDAIPAYVRKVGLSFRNWSDSKILWNSLPSTICDLGKEVRTYRNASFLRAVHAMEEASASEGVIRCLSMFADLCESSQKDSRGPVAEQFLNLHENMKNAAKGIDALIEARNLEAKKNNSLSSQQALPEICSNFPNTNALSWVQAAVETDLSRFSLLRKEGNKGVENGEKCFYVMIEKAAKGIETENPPSKNKRSPRNPEKLTSKSNAKSFPSSSKRHLSVKKGKKLETEEWFGGNGLKDAASLAEKLLSLSCGWFLKYLENFLNKGFRPTGGKVNSETAAILAQIKRVNRWLDDSFPQGSGVDERIDDLRKKLYGFLLDHLDSSSGMGRMFYI